MLIGNNCVIGEPQVRQAGYRLMAREGSGKQNLQGARRILYVDSTVEQPPHLHGPTCLQKMLMYPALLTPHRTQDILDGEAAEDNKKGREAAEYGERLIKLGAGSDDWEEEEEG